MKLIFQILILICISKISVAQSIPAFETNPEKYLQQVTKLLDDTKREDLKALSKQFETVWINYPSNQQQEIIAISNAMHDRKMILVPYYIKYFQSIASFPNSKLSTGVFEDWQEIALKVIQNQKAGNNKLYENYLDFSQALFGNNAIFESAARVWKFSSQSFELKYENNVPSIEFPETDLFAYLEGDTILIKQTSGKYFPFENKWYGNKAETNFERGGLDPDNVFVKFNKYSIDCDKSEYTVDSALLSYQPFVKNALMGQFTDKLITNNKPETSTYPRFVSYQKILNIDNFGPNVKYVGGITLEGGKINGSGDKDQKAQFYIYRYDGQLGCVVSSVIFSIKKFDDIYSNNAEIRLYVNKDSIFHPGCVFKYRISTKNMTIQRGDQGVAKSAFFDSYHQQEIYAEAIVWNTDNAYMDFKMLVAADATPSYFESTNYFEKNRLDKYQNVSDQNIINILKTYREKYDTNRINMAELAFQVNPKFTAETIRRTVYKLVEDGFVFYDEANEIVTIRRKTWQYVLADQKKIDYDIIKITSQNGDFNSRLDLKSFGMGIRGVKNIKLSDSSFVVIFPKNDSMTMMKNRDMNFDGMFFAGRADFYGKNFGFSYDGFNITSSNADTMLLNIPNGQVDKTGSPVLVPIKSCIQRVTGIITIDNKLAKSGGKKHDWTYPIVKTTDKSYVYYDQPKTFGGIYDRKKFYFELDPFELDSLNSFKPAKIFFTGKLVSSGIFPDITEKIGIQKDLSLGFISTQTDIALYGGKGKFTSKISLDNRGLRGNGDIKFLSSVTKSNDIIFYPDSTYAHAQSYNIPKGPFNGVPYPKVEVSKAFVHWKPNADSMVVDMDSIPFTMFENDSKLTGQLVLRSVGLRGSGLIDWSDAKLKSGDISFGSNSIKADTSDFFIKSVDPAKFALKTAEVNAKIDFDKQLGEFKSNTDDIATELPYNQYRTSINEFKWNIAKKQLTFFAPEGSESEFTSIHPDQDSLKFTGKSALYDLTTYILKVNQVPYIIVVDARVYADSNKVVIEPGAIMRTLNKARIIADTINEFHKFTNCTVNIYGKQNYKANGVYDFISENGAKQKINFTDITQFKDSTKKLITIAKTQIDTSQKFSLIPKIQYQGKVQLQGNKEPINFNGFAKLQVVNPNIRVDWFSINNNFTPDSTLIYYADPENLSKRPVTTGIVFYSDSSDLYTSFFNAKRSVKDKNIFIANGIVFYDETTKEFIAGDKNKIVNQDKRGNMLKYSDASGKVYCEGKMDMGLNFGLVDVQSAGTINTDVKKNEYKLNLLAGVSFNLDKDLLEMLGKSILNNNFSQEDVDYFSDEFQLNISEFIDPKNDKKFTEQLNKEGTFKKPEDSKFTIFFTDLNMVWDKENRSFRSTGPIGISYVGAVAINRLIEGAYLEIGYKKTGDFMNLYIPGDDDNYYFFFYQNNNMQIVSGNRAFTTALTSIDPDKRRTKTEDGKIYQYNIGSENKKNNFVTKMELLNAPPAPKK
jgi:hypothetical protein